MTTSTAARRAEVASSESAAGQAAERPAILARGLTKSYQEDSVTTEVLRGVDLEVGAGELVAIVGPSGSGKSTLLHLLGGLDRPHQGTIEVAGERLGSLDAERLARFRNRKIGFVFQFHQLLPDFTVLENVMMPGRIGGFSNRYLRRRAEELLDEVGLEERLRYFPNQLSGGERQRVALCRALLLEPPVLLADEPTGNLDPAAGESVMALLFDLRARLGTTTLMVTHNPQLAIRCGRVLLLEKGHLEARSGG